MIGRFSLIRNVGRFDNFSGAANTDLTSLSLVYAENARGKTTLCAILRSLQSGDPTPITERKRLGGAGDPHVVVQLSPQSSAIYQNGGWSATVPDMYIYDDAFVDENVYSGLQVDASHRSGLHQLIIGRQGVRLAKVVEDLTADISQAQSAVRDAARAIDESIRGDLTVDAFCALQEIDDVSEALMAARRRLAAFEQSAKVGSTANFSAIALPTLDLDAWRDLLASTYEQLDTVAYEKVQAHLNTLVSSCIN